MRIGELSRLTGVSPRSLRWYGEQSLLSETRTSGGHREYDEDAVERVRTIQVLFAAGVPARHMAGMLPCIYTGTTCPATLERLEEERIRLRAQAAGLAATLERLDEVVVQARALLTTV
ncbi:MerR family transcriptional regulator [Kineococcus rhizosphaerae]|uniref:DNA-binding transcriptional MerR regulator n=1 Tax=Kineococcus rhizosphaerae TaxID=559628 RepID=A0A2T0R4Y4_9ACTN|nr:MerR family transcriptional regulator [Kineococcus rhizosphaerae]PRY15804.1 DNA-binding transcriptional MerR regulator [Kineococcus rhizosphaerae]